MTVERASCAVCCACAQVVAGQRLAQTSGMLAAFALLLLAAEPRFEVLPAIDDGLIALYPVVRLDSSGTPDVTGLSRGLKSGVVSVEELESPEVRRVRLTNRGLRAVLVFAGEIIVGGNQDRVLAREALIPAGESVDLDVFCVEHARWSSSGPFKRSGGLGDVGLRSRLLLGDQEEIWRYVAERTRATRSMSPTGSYIRMMESEKVRTELSGRHSAFLDRLAVQPRKQEIVGFVVAVAGRLELADVFASPALFGSFATPVLDAAFLSAVGVKASFPAPPVAAAQALLDRPPAAATFSNGRFVHRAVLAP